MYYSWKYILFFWMRVMLSWSNY